MGTGYGERDLGFAALAGRAEEGVSKGLSWDGTFRDLLQEGIFWGRSSFLHIRREGPGKNWLCFHAWMEDLERKDVIALMLCWLVRLKVTSIETAGRYVIVMEEGGNGRDFRG
ncbi:uncharacterized protein EAE98_009864 [Botrytis deweyae]|uniref:Uncharacterized protein n=1 Tax=Botrytis deweyae TaxID=2478750 RepID=A0ABQ7IAG1_9HELO|nr:uncharacterized protein EAE98_009864 [Botrytis deweyae]KAF7918252.1 hypothetical protein EAE98_009864 [Botrytis deweyae]